MKRLLSPTSSPKPHPRLGFDLRRTAARWEDAKCFRSWLVYDSDLELSRSGGSVNWSVIVGLVVMAVVSASGWYGISLLVRLLIK
jgi:hypothetical protein